MEIRSRRPYYQHSENAVAYKSLLNASLHTLLLGNMPVPGVSILQAMRSPCLIVLAPQVFNMHYLAAVTSLSHLIPNVCGTLVDLENIELYRLQQNEALLADKNTADSTKLARSDKETAMSQRIWALVQTQIPATVSDPDLKLVGGSLFEGCNRYHAPPVATGEDELADNIQDEEFSILFDRWEDASQETQDENAHSDTQFEASDQWEEVESWEHESQRSSRPSSPAAKCDGTRHASREFGDDMSLWNLHVSTKDCFEAYDEPMDLSFDAQKEEDVVKGTPTGETAHDQQVRFDPRIDDDEDLIYCEPEEEEPRLDTPFQHDEDFSHTDSTQGFEKHGEWWNLDPSSTLQVPAEPACTVEERYTAPYLGFGSPTSENDFSSDMPKETPYTYEHAASTDHCPWQDNLEEDADEGLPKSLSPSSPSEWLEDAGLAGCLQEDGMYLVYPN